MKKSIFCHNFVDQLLHPAFMSFFCIFVRSIKCIISMLQNVCVCAYVFAFVCVCVCVCACRRRFTIIKRLLLLPSTSSFMIYCCSLQIKASKLVVVVVFWLLLLLMMMIQKPIFHRFVYKSGVLGLWHISK